MKNLKQILSIVLSVGTALSSINSTHGSGILAEMNCVSMMRRAGYVSVSSTPWQNYIQSAKRSYSDKKNSLLSLVNKNADFQSVTFRRSNYLAYARKQSQLSQKVDQYKSTPVYSDRYDMFFFPKDTQSKISNKRKINNSIEANVSDKNPLPKPVKHMEFKELPFDGSGRLKAENNDYRGVGSATLFDNDAIITAGHNFLNKINGKIQRFKRASYTHKSKHKKDSIDVDIAEIHIHPKWEKTEDPDYDVAVAFLKEKIPMTKKISLFKDGTINENGVLVTGYPESTEHMHQSLGNIVPVQNSSDKQIYHNANTRVGNSGGSIVFDDDKVMKKTRGRDILVGIHTGVQTQHANRGVRLRADILDFIAEAIKKRESNIKQSIKRSKRKSIKK
jgi:V8-like Glu-specific endopeptidase